MSGKSKPELGVILTEAPKFTGKTVSAEIVLGSGKAATVGFEVPDSKWDLQDGGYYDVETRNKAGDTSYIQVAALPKGQTLASLKPSFFTKEVLGVEGRYGSYGAPVDVKILSDATTGNTRIVDISFSALSPGMAEVARRATLAATEAGGSDVVMLVSGTNSVRWKKEGGEAAARKTAGSFRVVDTRPTELKQVPAADYRYGKTYGPSNMSSRNDGF